MPDRPRPLEIRGMFAQRVFLADGKQLVEGLFLDAFDAAGGDGELSLLVLFEVAFLDQKLEDVGVVALGWLVALAAGFGGAIPFGIVLKVGWEVRLVELSPLTKPEQLAVKVGNAAP